MNEDELRAAFARHEAEAPDVEELHHMINKEAGRRRRRRGAALAGGVAAGIALAVGVPVYLTGQAAPIDKAPVAAATATAAHKDLNLLLVGSDRRDSWTKDNARADTIMIVHVPADRQRMYVISVERDSLVDIPGHGREKINAALSFGGLDLVEQTLTQLSGVKFDGGAVVEYAALRSITDTLGGVPVCLKTDVPLYLAYGQQPRKTLKAGCRELNGADAEALLRQRYGLDNGGYERDRNAQRYLLGVAEKVSSLDLGDAATVLRLINTRGLTISLTDITVPELALQLRGVKATDVVALSLSDTFHGGGQGEVIPPQGLALLAALKEANLAKFVQEHPEMVLLR